MTELKENPAANSKKPPVGKMRSEFRNFAIKYLLLGLAAASSLILFLWLAEAVYEGETILFDETIRQIAQQSATPWLTQTMIYVSFLGSFRFLTGGVIVFLIVFSCLKWKQAVILLLVTMAGEAFLEVTLKLFFKRVRPEPFIEYAALKSYSFPSGHALASLCFYGILAWLMTARIKTQGLRFLIWISATTLILFIGSSRIYLGVHFPSDILAGFAAGFVWLFTVACTDYYLGKKNSQI